MAMRPSARQSNNRRKHQFADARELADDLITHFYGISTNEEGEWFSYGLIDENGIYVPGLVVYDGAKFLDRGRKLRGPDLPNPSSSMPSGEQTF